MTDFPGHFSSKQLRIHIDDLPQTRKIWVGFSGGADSTALLLALHRSREQLISPIHAIYFHHGLHPMAEEWLGHCRDFCTPRNIPFTSRILKLNLDGSDSIEETARNGRYQVMAQLLDRDDIYLTAHHADDQAETLLMNLVRGGGIEGLAGIPERRSLGAGLVARPLLAWRKSDLENYLRKHDVPWLEDPSNEDESFDRNFLRNQLFPLIESRWPGLVKNLNRSALHARVASEALAEFINSSAGDLLHNPHRMPLAPLLRLNRPMRGLVLRQWLRTRRIPALSQARTDEFLNQLAGATTKSGAEVKWGNWQLKLHRQFIWLQDLEETISCSEQDWPDGMKLALGTNQGYIQLHGKPTKLPQKWRIGPRTAGSKIRLYENGRSTTLKELYRQMSAPPWLRSAIPVLYWGDDAVAIGDWVMAEKLKLWLKSNELEYRWHPEESLLVELQSFSRHLAVDR